MAMRLVLQQWLTVSLPDGAQVTQSEVNWLDCERFRDVLAIITVANAVGFPTFSLETSPSKDEDLFMDLGLGFDLAPDTVWRSSNYFASATIPIARFVRWRLRALGGADTSATFRVDLVLSSHTARLSTGAHPSRLLRFAPPGQ